MMSRNATRPIKWTCDKEMVSIHVNIKLHHILTLSGFLQLKMDKITLLASGGGELTSDLSPGWSIILNC